MAQARDSAGFTLIEIAITLGIVAITTSLAVASYRQYLVRSHRIEAVHALIGAAADQEKFHLTYRRYAERLDAGAGSDPPGLATASRTARGHYRLTVELADATGFRIVASATQEQHDPLCAQLFIDESGRRGARDASGADSTTRCW